jgi:hypothetical protein
VVAVLIALLAVLGVDLIVLVVLLAAVLGRRRWLRRQDGAFGGVAHLVAGDLDGLGARRRRGYGRWVHDVLVWTPAPLFLRNTLAPVDRVEGTHPAPKGQVRRLGDDPLLVTLTAGRNRIEIAVRPEDRERALAPFTDAEPEPIVPTPRPAGPVLEPRDG